MTPVRPCPFCVCEEVFAHEITFGPALGLFIVGCQACRAQGPKCATAELAVAAWNKWRDVAMIPNDNAPAPRGLSIRIDVGEKRATIVVDNA